MWLFFLFWASSALAGESQCESSCVFGYSGDVEDFVCFCPPRSEDWSSTTDPNSKYPKPGYDSNGRRYYIEIERRKDGWHISQKYIRE